MAKKYSNNKLHNSTCKNSSLFDTELNKRLKDIETATKAKIYKVRMISENRKIDSAYEP